LPESLSLIIKPLLPPEFAMLEWVDWFNNRRLLEPIGNIPPAEAEARYYAQANERKPRSTARPGGAARDAGDNDR
jgi:hypothetical protein